MFTNTGVGELLSLWSKMVLLTRGGVSLRRCSLEYTKKNMFHVFFFSHIHHCVLQAIMNHTWLDNFSLTLWKTHHSGAAEGNQPSFYSFISYIFLFMQMMKAYGKAR